MRSTLEELMHRTQVVLVTYLQFLLKIILRMLQLPSENYG
jgi:hypothetical protein